MKFQKGKSSLFYTSLSEKIDSYFITNNKSKTGGFQIIIKAIILIAIFIFTYAIIVFMQPDLKVYLTCMILLGINSVVIFFNFVHDASHRVLFKSKLANRLFCYMGDIVGVNTYMWHIRHDIQHHSFTNVLGGDLIIENIPLLRLSPHQKFRSFHRYQLLYIPLFYSLYSIYWIFVLDFKLFFKKNICNIKNLRHPIKEWLKLVFFKIFYVVYLIVIPIMVLPFSWVVVVAGFILMHLFAGTIISLVSVLGHNVEGTTYPIAVDDSIIQNSWGEHELETTADFANKSRLLTWLIGGLNTHICHHLFPNICHVHYYKLTPILRDHCNTQGYKFNEYSLSRSIKSHIKYIKYLSR